MNRWIALVALAVVCWVGAMGCKGSGAPADTAPLPGENVAVSKSLFIPVKANSETQFYRVDVEPVTNVDAGKGVASTSKFKGYNPKGSLTSHLKHDSNSSVIGISPFNELVLECLSCPDHQARLVGKDYFIDILKNRNLMGPFSSISYDDIGDRLLFTAKGDDGNAHLMQRSMDGKESELYQDKVLAVMMLGFNHTAYLFGEKGIFALTMADGKITKLSDPLELGGGMGLVDRNGTYLLFPGSGKSRLVKSDGTKTFDLPAHASAKLYRPDLNEFVFKAESSAPAPATKMTPPLKVSNFRLDLQSGNVTTLYNDNLGVFIDHVGDQYLVGNTDSSDGNQSSFQLSWLKPDGTLQDIVTVPSASNAKVVGYNPQKQLVLIEDEENKLTLVSVKEAKIVATLENTFVRPIFLFSTVLDVPVLLTFQTGSTPGSFNVGLLSPDTLGGASGTELVPVALGAIDTKDAAASVSQQILTTDIHEDKVRTPAAVADATAPTPACIPKCDGTVCGDDGCGGKCTVCGDPCIPNCTDKQCGSDGCSGVCGACGDGKTCNEAWQCVAKVPAGPAPTIAGVPTMPVLSIPVGTTKKLTQYTIIKSSIGLASVDFECGGGITIATTSKFELPDHSAVYSFRMIIGNVNEASICKITAKDTSGQTTSESFQVIPSP